MELEMCRMTVVFGPDQAAAIEGLASELSTTKTEILRTGLRLLRLAVREVKRGNGIGVVRNGAVVNEITGVWSEAEAESAA